MTTKTCKPDIEKILEKIAELYHEKHKTCLDNDFDNGYFWAMKDLERYILKEVE